MDASRALIYKLFFKKKLIFLTTLYISHENGIKKFIKLSINKRALLFNTLVM